MKMEKSKMESRNIVGRIMLAWAMAWGAWIGGTVARAEAWDEAGVDWIVPEIPDVREESPALARARSVARGIAREMGASEEQAEQAAFAVPENLEEWKSPLQLAFEEHRGEEPTDGDPLAPAVRVSRAKVVPRAAPKAITAGKRVLGWHPSWATLSDIEGYQYSNLTTIAYFSYAVNSTNGGYDSMGS